ncbi:MAG: hypothetical protein JSW47_17870 [Phycisphaerales bacterium]|nr:MAG: hypothetical protein JSW47_17870 [Phycisphaerales bacterium]
MKNQRLSLEEFKVLFGDKFESQAELLAEYESFASTFEQLDQAVVPEMSAGQKAEIFRQSWQGRPQEPSWVLTLLSLIRQPALTFALGIVIGCIVMSAVKNDPIDLTAAAAADGLLEVTHTRYSRTYKGKIIKDFYSEFENPEVVLEKTQETAPPQWTVHGTLDNGEIYVVWNL